MELILCDYAGCGNSCTKDEMEIYNNGYVDYHACPVCAELVSNQTGYCGITCQFGYGCDQSC